MTGDRLLAISTESTESAAKKITAGAAATSTVATVAAAAAVPASILNATVSISTNGTTVRYENGLFEPFIYINDDFTKTGSGQT
jgi:hypothetical protein